MRMDAVAGRNGRAGAERNHDRGLWHLKWLLGVLGGRWGGGRGDLGIELCEELIGRGLTRASGLEPRIRSARQ
jgi:hypothetical protein